MDELFELKNGLFWLEACPVGGEQTSAFVPYRITGGGVEDGSSSSSSCGNMNKRMMELLRRRSGKREPERDRCFRHMMNERMRREKHKESFSSLHAMLPQGTKNDKNSIMQMAAREILVMMRYKEELRRRNKEMEATFMTSTTNGIDSLLELLNCLRTTGSDVISLSYGFSDSNQQLVQLLFQNKIAVGGDVNAVRKRLDQVDKKLQGDCQEG